MKQIVVGASTLLFTFTLYAQKKEFPREKQEAVKEVLENYIGMGIPGLALTVYNKEVGFWSYADGVANIEQNTPLTNDHLFYLQSVAKTYMAVTILQLYEKGKLALEDPIIEYLDYDWLHSFDKADELLARPDFIEARGIAALFLAQRWLKER